MFRNLYAEVSARILTHLESGKIPWIKPWSASAGRNQPQNAVTRRPYSGVNVVLLWQPSYPVPHYLTFQQAKQAGGTVKKGEHGTRIYFVKQCLKGEDAESDDEGRRVFTVLKEFVVFNIDQCEGLPDKLTTFEPPKPRHSDSRHDLADSFIKTTGCDFRDGEGGDRAYYSPALDFIAVPHFDNFNSASAYYSTAFHELGHWTGHEKRLARDFRNRFGTEAYAAEELVAELTSAFLCAEFDIDGQERHSAAYLQGWISLLKHNPKAFFTAASKAQAAADYMRGLALASDSKIAA